MKIRIQGRLDNDTQDVDIDVTLRPGARLYIDGVLYTDMHNKLEEALAAIADAFDQVNELVQWRDKA